MNDLTERVSNLEQKCNLPSQLAETLANRITNLENQLGVVISSLPTNLSDRISNLETVFREKLNKS